MSEATALIDRQTAYRKMMIKGARLSPPAAWIIDATGGRIGHERTAWKLNCHRLESEGVIYANGHGDWTLTAVGEEMRRILIDGAEA